MGKREIPENKKVFINRIILILLSVVIFVLFMPTGKIHRYSDLKIGTLAPERIEAPYDYEIVKTQEELERDRDLIRLKIPPYFDYVPLESTYTDRFRELLKDYDSLNKFERSVSAEHEKYEQLKLKQEADTLRVDSLKNEQYLDSLEENIAELEKKLTVEKGMFYKKHGFLYSNLKTEYLSDFSTRRDITKHLQRIRNINIIDTPKEKIRNRQTNNFILLKDGKFNSIEFDEVNDSLEFNSDHYDYLYSNFPDQENDSLKFWYGVLKKMTIPNMYFNKVRTDSVIVARQSEVPLAKGLVKKGEEIVDKNMIITKDIYDKLMSLEKKEKENFENKSTEKYFESVLLLNYSGKFLYLLLPFSILLLTLYNNRKTIFYDIKKFSVLLLIIVFQVTLVYALSKYLPTYSEYLSFIAVAGLLGSIFFDLRVSFIVVTICSMIISTIMGNSFNYLFVSLIIGFVSAYSVGKIRDRLQLFRASFYIFFAQIVVSVTFYLLTNIPFEKLQLNVMQGLVSSVLAPIIAFGMMIFIEAIFRIPTDITLLELSDMRRPLLRKLQLEAPGTYHHSIVVGNLAEAATEAVGGNSLLARVGAYYHDIGKTFKPEYFIENQKSKENLHNKLPANMSSLILANHVKEGVKLAQDYKLPSIIIDFITMHHGVGKMEFFYHKALENAKETGEQVNEADYRYPGPRPQTKETAILMIADIVEAKCRTIENPNYDKYYLTIGEIIKQKFAEGQLDECDLKLNDLKKIQAAMAPVISAMYHNRVKYPSQVKADEEKKTQQQQKKTSDEKEEDKTKKS